MLRKQTFDRMEVWNYTCILQENSYTYDKSWYDEIDKGKIRPDYILVTTVEFGRNIFVLDYEICIVLFLSN